MVAEIESVFFWLIEEAEKHHTKEEIKSILEKTDNAGDAVIIIASDMSELILEKLLELNVRPNNIDNLFGTPGFKFKKWAKLLMRMKLNPKVMNCNGNSQLNKLNPSTFESTELRRKALEFPGAIYYSTEDQKCEKDCPNECPANMDAYYFKNGKFLKRDKKNRIGQGAAKVFKGKWHQKEAAFKFIPITNLTWETYSNENVADLESRLAEIKKVPRVSGANILVPIGSFRQQEQTDENGEIVAHNFEVFVFPLLRMNLAEFKETHNPTGPMLLFILKETLQRYLY